MQVGVDVEQHLINVVGAAVGVPAEVHFCHSRVDIAICAIGLHWQILAVRCGDDLRSVGRFCLAFHDAAIGFEHDFVRQECASEQKRMKKVPDPEIQREIRLFRAHGDIIAVVKRKIAGDRLLVCVMDFKAQLPCRAQRTDAEPLRISVHIVKFKAADVEPVAEGSVLVAVGIKAAVGRLLGKAAHHNVVCLAGKLPVEGASLLDDAIGPNQINQGIFRFFQPILTEGVVALHFRFDGENPRLIKGIAHILAVGVLNARDNPKVACSGFVAAVVHIVAGK